MAVDKVKALKIENATTGGTQTDPYPTETNPASDYLATKGLSFENLDTFLLDKVGRSLVETFPDLYQVITYTSGIPTVAAFYNSGSFITANRIAQYDLAYTGDDLTSEILKIYDTNGTTILRTYTWAHTYTSGDLASSGLVIT